MNSDQLPKSFHEHDAMVQATALQKFRARRRKKQTMQAFGGGLALVAILIVTRRHDPVRHAGKPGNPGNVSSLNARTPERKTSDESHSLTDEELLAAFPPGSCFLAEVNGQKRLVFRDPEVKKQFFN